MAQVGKQVVASHFFFNGLLSLPHYAELCEVLWAERSLAILVGTLDFFTCFWRFWGLLGFLHRVRLSVVIRGS